MALLYTATKNDNQYIYVFRVQDVAYLSLGLVLVSNLMRQDLFGTGIYVITRQETRLIWFARMCLRIFVLIWIYVAAYIFTLSVMVMMKNNQFGFPGVWWAVLYSLLLSLLLYSFALMLNVLACRWSTAYGFLFVLAAFTALVIVHTRVAITFNPNNFWHVMDMRFNPVSILGSENGTRTFSVTSYVMVVVYALIMTAASAFEISRMDIALHDLELE